MIVAVQGCSHGSLTAIYDSVSQYESRSGKKVDLLLLCGDFQALRSAHDFASLAVPPKYHALGTFHEYYSGKRVAPVLTIVIGGNHEASSYMWELYHGGWLAPSIYYMGAAGCVRVGGLRIVGASGIYKGHDYTKGHFETVPYDHGSMRSIYHIRQYDVAKLLQLTPEDNTIFLSHDWPTTIPNHGDTAGLLRRKPFFQDEVHSNTLGSPPLLQLLKHNKPEYWFSAHLHVKFAAVYDHAENSQSNGVKEAVPQIKDEPAGAGAGNPDEIDLDDDKEEPLHQQVNETGQVAPVENPDEIAIDDDDDNDDLSAQTSLQPDLSTVPAEEAKAALAVDESADLVEAARKADSAAAQGVIGVAKGDAAVAVPEASVAHNPSSEAGPSRPSRGVTKFLALDKCGPGKDFIQYLDIPSAVIGAADKPLSLTYDPEWLAITRVFHPFLSLDVRQKALPLADHLASLVRAEQERIESEGLLVPPDLTGKGEEAAEVEQTPARQKGAVVVERIQRFRPTAPAHGEPGGSPTAWYTNPQTEAFCAMLEIPNKINPAPVPVDA